MFHYFKRCRDIEAQQQHPTAWRLCKAALVLLRKGIFVSFSTFRGDFVWLLSGSSDSYCPTQNRRVRRMSHQGLLETGQRRCFIRLRVESVCFCPCTSQIENKDLFLGLSTPRSRAWLIVFHLEWTLLSYFIWNLSFLSNAVADGNVGWIPGPSTPANKRSNPLVKQLTICSVSQLTQLSHLSFIYFRDGL